MVSLRSLLNFLKLTLAVFLFGVLPITSTACHYSTFDFISYTNNLNGTYTITVQVCLAVTDGYGGTTDFTITPSGGTFTSVSSIQTSTYSTSYCYNTFFTGGCASAVVNMGSYINVPGCGTGTGNWLAPSFNTGCTGPPYNVCDIITFTTNGLPSTVVLNGVENDVNWNGGGNGCPAQIYITNACSGFFYDTGGPSGNYTNYDQSTTILCSDNGQSVIVDFTAFSLESGYDYLYIFDGQSTSSPQITGSPFTGSNSPGTITSSGTCFTFMFTSDPSVAYSGWIASISCPPCVPPSSPLSISGSTTPCVGSSQVYSVPSVTGALYYTWTVPPGWTINSGQGTTSINVTPSSNSGNICVTADDFCGQSSPTCISVTPDDAPNTPGSITGNTNPCSNATETYSITAVTGATSYNWTVPSGWTIVSGQGTTNITVNPGSNSGNICVEACNSCGCSALSCTAVNPTRPPNQPVSISGLTTPCVGTTQTYSISSVNGATNYQWQLPTGWSIVSGQGTTSITVNVGSSTGTVCVAACNSCGCSISTCINVTPNDIPSVPVSISGPSFSCPGSNETYSITTVPGASSYTWTIPSGWSLNSGQGSSSINVTTGTNSGNILVQACNTCGCSADQTLAVTISDLASTISSTPEICNGSCDGTASVVASGGQPPYTYSWSNGCSSSTCTSLCAGSYDVTISDQSSCQIINNVSVSTGPSTSAGFTYNGNQCLTGNNYCFTNTGTSGVNYAWDFGDGLGTSSLENPCYTYTTSGNFTVTQIVTQGPCTETTSINIVVYDEPIINVFSSNITCNGICDGLIDIGINAGQSPYTFAWNSGQSTEDISGLCQGTYTITVSDNNGCFSTNTSAISEPSSLVVNPTANDPTCNGLCNGDASINTSGGIPPYSYSWDDPMLQTSSTATGLCAGTYNVTATDSNGCTNIGIVTLTEPAQISLVFNTTDATCGANDGSACVTPTGGTSPYTYIWDDPSNQTSSCANNLFGGGYNVTVTDANGCQQTNPINVNTNLSVFLSLTDSSDVSCKGGNDGYATVLGSGGSNPYTYQWNTVPIQTNATATGLSAGAWTVNITDALGCTNSMSINIDEPSILTAQINTTVPASCNGICDGQATTISAGGTGSHTYSWSPSGGTLSTGTGLCAGITYTVTVQDSNNCSTSDTITISEPNSLNLSITTIASSCNGGNDGIADLTVSGGSPGYNFIWSNGSVSEDISNLAAGSYCVTVNDNNGCIDSTCLTITEPNPIATTNTITDAYCGLSNGQACISPNGGTAPFSYLWDDPNSQTNSCATGLLGNTTYNVTITDSLGCVTTGTAFVNDQPGGNATINLDNNTSGFGICDGQATATMTGGVSPFTYNWNDPNSQTTATADSLCAGNWCVTITDSAGCTSHTCILISEPPQIVTNIIGIDPGCNGDCNGQADLTIIGGIPPYTYSWSPGGFVTQDLISLCAGTYVVTVTDANSIIVIDSITIIEPSVLTSNITTTDAICNGNCTGTATANISGGTSPFSYSWNDPSSQTTATAIGLCAGNYVLTTTDTNGCILISNITVNEPLPLSINTTSTNATCGQNDGTTTANITNGNTPYTFLWNDPSAQTTQTAISLVSGTYQVIVIDSAGCIDSAMASVGDNQGPTGVFTDTTNVSCFGACDGSATVFASNGTAPYTYFWNPSGQSTPVATNLCGGTQTVDITDATGCVTNVSVFIVEPTDLSANATVISDPKCTGTCDGVTHVSATGGTLPYTYQWNDPMFQTGVYATSLCAGSYNILVTDANGCIANGSTTLIEPTQLSVSISTTDVSCGGSCDGSASVVPSGGTIPYNYSWSNGDNTQTADSLCATTYVINVIDTNGCTISATATIDEPTVLSASIFNYQDASCNGNCNGFATLTQSGGTAPYTYTWSNGQNNATAINLCTGNYTGTVTDANGCSDTVTVTIGQPSTLMLSVSKSDVECNGACDGTATATPTGGNPPYTYQWNDPLFQTTSLADSLCDGLFSVTVSDASGCIQSANILIIEPTDLSIIVSSSDSSTCGFQNGGACVNIAGGAFPYFIQWNDPLFTLGSCIDSVYAGVYKVYVLDANGCFDSIPITINDIVAPTIDSISTTPDNCYGDSIGTATVLSVSNNTGAINYIWRNINGDTLLSGLGINSITNLPGGTYTITILDNATGCITSEVFIIDQPSPLNTAVFPTNITQVTCNGICDGSAQVSVSGGSSPYTYSWFPSGGNSIIDTNLCSGNNIITVSDSLGCVDSTSINLSSPATILVNANITHVSCYGGNDGQIDLLPTPSGGTPPYAYNWYPPGIAGNVPTATNLFAGIDSVIVTDLQGCTQTLIATINEPTELIIDSIQTIADFCGSSLGSVTVIASGGTSSYTYSWNTNPTQTGPSATGLLAGIYTVTVIDANGCTSSGPVTVPGTPGPVIDSIIVSQANCYGTNTGQAQVLTSSGITPYTYLWNDPSSQTTGIATGLLAGTYIVTVSDVNNCQDFEIITITEPDSIEVYTFQEDLVICYGDSTQISAVVTGGVNPIIRSWDNGLPDSSSHIVSPQLTTTYNVTVVDVNGCVGNGSITVIVNAPLNLEATLYSSVCFGDTANLFASPTGGNGGPYYITWDDGTSSTMETISTGDTSNLSIQPTNTTYIWVFVTDSCSISDSVLMAVSVKPLPDVGFFSIATQTGCATSFIDTSIGYLSMGGPSSDTLIDLWMWDFGDGSIIGADSGTITGIAHTSGYYNNPTHIYNQPGNYDVTVTVTDFKQCTNSLTIPAMITVTPPVANFSTTPNPTSLSSPTVSFTDNSTGNIENWYWDFNDPSSGSNNNSTNQYPTHEYSDTGTYSVMLIITDSTGCIDTVYNDVTINQEQIIYVPNIFSPSTDGINNKLYVSGLGLNSMSFMIYDRWGKLIFETKSDIVSGTIRPDGKCCYFGKGWDGTKDGKELDAQVFVYYLEATFENGDNITKKGNITLIK